MQAPSTSNDWLPADTRMAEQVWLAPRYLRTRRVAMVSRSSIGLWGVSRQEFLANAGWVRHEACHLRQYRRYGTLGFLVRYGWGWLWHGYRQHAMEQEARAAEAQ
jgi:hypothetical protein